MIRSILLPRCRTAALLVGALIISGTLARAEEAPKAAPTPPAVDAGRPAPPPQTKAPGLPAIPARAPAGSEEIKVSHILVGTEEEAAAVRKEVVEKGGDRKAFTMAARKHSKDVSTKVLGGDLGYIGTQSGFDKAFSAEAFRLKPGEISPPVKSAFGWHLILVTDRRDRQLAKAQAAAPTPKEGTHGDPGKPQLQPAKDTKGGTVTPPPGPVTPAPGAVTPAPGAVSNAPKPAAGPDDLAPRPPAVTPAPGTPAPQLERAVPPAPAVEPKRRPLRDQGIRVMLETVKTSELGIEQFTFPPDQALEVNVIVKNEGQKEQLFFTRELLPLGLRIGALGDRTPIPGDFTKVQEPANFFVTLKPYDILGLEVSLSDYWKSLPPRRYGVNWDINSFFTALEARFPKVKDLPDYQTLSTALRKRFIVRTDVVIREVSPRITFQRNRDLAVSVFEQPDPNKKYYARIVLASDPQPVIIQLNTQKQFRAARHFMGLVHEGFYDGLDFFEVEPGDYLLGGCPTRTGTGAPSSVLPIMRNDGAVDHKRGTVSFVSRSVRSKGPVTGGQLGSIFVVCLKPHPEWNEEHVPFGEITSGIEALEKVTQTAVFREVSILTEDQLGTQATAPDASSAFTAGNPEAVIKTSKGDLTVELFEDVARNTVANFISLAESGFYSKDAAGSGKQKFFYLMKDDSGRRILIQTGSPKNDFEGGPGYNIADEPNPKKHLKGALVMVTQYEERSKGYVPNTAGSQFFICLTEIPSYDFQERKFTVFGQVKGGLDVLDKLEQDDVLDSIQIQKKKSHPYAVSKIPTP